MSVLCAFNQDDSNQLVVIKKPVSTMCHTIYFLVSRLSETIMR